MSLEQKIKELGIAVANDIKKINGVFVCTLAGDINVEVATFIDIGNWDPPEINTVDGIQFNQNGEITISSSGIYCIKFETTLNQYAGNNRTSADVRIVRNGNLIKGTLKKGYHRSQLDGKFSYSIDRTIQLTNGDVIKVQAKNDDAIRLQRILSDCTLLTIRKL